MEGRLTYRSSWGDYGSAIDWANDREAINALRNKLGKYEDNEWVSVAKYGNPKFEKMYEVTVMKINDNTRWTDIDFYNVLSGFSKDNVKGLHIVAWRNLPEPYKGD